MHLDCLEKNNQRRNQTKEVDQKLNKKLESSAKS